MKKLLIIIVALIGSFLQAKEPITWTPFVQQTGAYFTSDRVTSAGLGIGGGTMITNGRHLVAQADLNVMWINGNAVSTRLAAGYQRSGRWSPAILGTFGLYWGQRTEVLSKAGERPISPIWVTGIRLAPIRFQGNRGLVSALEFGFGIGPYQGQNLEITILSGGTRW